MSSSPLPTFDDGNGSSDENFRDDPDFYPQSDHGSRGDHRKGAGKGLVNSLIRSLPYRSASPPPALSQTASTSAPSLLPPLPPPPPPSDVLSLTSYESARERPDSPRMVMTPGEAEELAELRRMLPMLRRMKTGASVPAEVERAPSPPRMRSRARSGRRRSTLSSPPNSPGSPGSRASWASGRSRSSGNRRGIEHRSPGLKNGALHGVFTTRASTKGGDSGSSSSGGSGSSEDGGASPAKNRASAVVVGVGGDYSDSDSDNSLIIGPARTTYVKLSRDVYSLLYFTLPFSIGFFFAIGIFIFQMLILTLIMVDIVDVDNRFNELNIPAGVSWVVRASQALAILVAVATQDDLITSINAMHIGYDGRLEQRMGVGGHYWQWVLSVSGRFFEGSLCLAVTFILIMQANEVVGLFLDFLAVTFVSTLDNIAFSLAQDGYFSQKICRETHEVSRVRVPRPTKKNNFFRPFVFFVVSASMLIGFSVVAYKQQTGAYLSCDRIAVQFGDEFRTTLAFFSSLYEVDHFDAGGRPVYVERGPDGHGGGFYGHAVFAYCASEFSWTFSYATGGFSSSAAGAYNSRENENVRNGIESSIDPCNWYAKSDETDSWDIMSVSGGGQWYVYGRESKSAKPFQHFSLLCVDCDDTDRGACSEVGTCVNGKCVCNEGRYGLNCEFAEPCANLSVDSSREGFPGPKEWSDNFRILYHRDNITKAKVYERPVFTNGYDEGGHHVIMYTGRRWILVESKSLTDLHRPDQPVASWQLAEYLTYSFHAHWSSYYADYISSPADVVTPTDAATPIGLEWFRTKSYNKGADENHPIDTLLLCTNCNNFTNPCRNTGVCGSDGTCSCPYGTFGALCQVNSFELCRTVSVKFGDELISTLPSLGGPYDLTNRTVAGRSVYVHRRRSGSIFAYCKSQRAWTLTLLPPGPGGRSFLDADPCDNWKVISSPTDTYDITALTTGWSVRRTNYTGEGMPLLYFDMSCADCGRNKRIPCGGGGECVNRACVCDEGKFGAACQLRDPCPVLEMEPSAEFGEWPARYELLRPPNVTNFKLYGRPVYISGGGNRDRADSEPSSPFLIFFTGSRWVVSRLDSLTDAVTVAGGEGNINAQRANLAQYLKRDFHGMYSNYTAELMSEPVRANTNTDVASPVDLSWYRPKLFDNKRIDLQAPLRTSPRCAFCNGADYPCYNGGVCMYGTCACPAGTYGTLCQVDSVCSSISIEFGPSLPAPLPSLSGVYNVRGRGDTLGGRPFYLLESSDNNAMLAYCREGATWTFSHWDGDEDDDAEEGGTGGKRGAAEMQTSGSPERLPDPCGDWVGRSAPSYSYDVIDTRKWQIRRNETSFIGLSNAIYSYACNDERRKRELGT